MGGGGAKYFFRRSRRCLRLKAGRPRFGSVRLRFGEGTVQAVPVFGSSEVRPSIRHDLGIHKFCFIGSCCEGWGIQRKNGSDGSGSVPEPPCLKDAKGLGHNQELPCLTFSLLISKDY